MAPVGWQEFPGIFETTRDATTGRVQRRLGYVLRQLEWRINEANGLRAKVIDAEAQLDGLRARLNDAEAQLEILRQQVDVRDREADAWRNAYEAMMATKTMRAVRIPRALYARIRGRL